MNSGLRLVNILRVDGGDYGYLAFYVNNEAIIYTVVPSIANIRVLIPANNYPKYWLILTIPGTLVFVAVIRTYGTTVRISLTRISPGEPGEEFSSSVRPNKTEPWVCLYYIPRPSFLTEQQTVHVRLEVL
jgi:hypothetical protein